jgi:hypothetical protein
METSESGRKPDNLDVSSLKPLPEKKKVGSGEEKTENPVGDNPSDKPEEPPKPRIRRRLGGAL